MSMKLLPCPKMASDDLAFHDVQGGRMPAMKTKKLVYKTSATPVGKLTLVACDEGLRAILWEHDDPRRVPLGDMTQDDSHPLLREADRQLQAYFSGALKQFSLKLAAEGTPFQKSVWEALTRIPYGETRSYAEIARQVGRPLAVRAVGAANGRNPISIVVPCHRVIGSNGRLTGFAGGLDAKAWLLAKEGGVSERLL